MTVRQLKEKCPDFFSSFPNNCLCEGGEKTHTHLHTVLRSRASLCEQIQMSYRMSTVGVVHSKCLPKLQCPLIPAPCVTNASWPFSSAAQRLVMDSWCQKIKVWTYTASKEHKNTVSIGAVQSVKNELFLLFYGVTASHKVGCCSPRI